MAAIPPQLIGESAEFHALSDWISDLAALEKPVLVLGERGTGKEMVASRLHFLSSRWEKTYLSVDCAVHDTDSFNTLLYGEDGYEGLLSQANGGTLFLDNIHHLSFAAQARLSRVIEYGVYDALDGHGEQTCTARFLASLAMPPASALAQGRLSANFLDRIGFDIVHIPPLRNRPADIAPLMIFFGRKMASELGAERFPGISPETMESLHAYSWPGNVRELKNVIERSTARAFLHDETLADPLRQIYFDHDLYAWEPSGSDIDGLEASALHNKQSTLSVAVPTLHFTAPAGRAAPNSQKPEKMAQGATMPLSQTDFTDRLMAFERGLIDEAMQVADHHQGRAAEHLNLTYHQFRGLLRKHGLKK